MLFFSLVLQAFLSVSLHPVLVWSCFLGLLSFWSAVVPGSLIPLRCLPFRRLVTGPVWSQGFLYLSTLGPQYPSVVLRRLPSVRRSSLGYGPTRFLSLLRLFGPFLGVLLSRFPPFRLLVSSRLALSVCRRVLWASLSAGSVFLPSLHGWPVGFSRGSTALASLRGQGGLFPRLSLFYAFGLCLFGYLPSSPVPPVSLRPGGCLFP